MSPAMTIGDIPLFEALSPEQRERVAGIAVNRAYTRGELIFGDGDPGTGFYVLTEGQVKIYKLSIDGREQILHVLGPGESFGEVPVFEGKNYPAYAESLTKCDAFYFPRGAFIDLVTREPSIALNMLAVLSRHLRQFVALVETLSLKEVPGRLAAHLLDLSATGDRRDCVRLDMPKNQLANLLGTIPETLSRILTRMTREGFIESLDNREVRILDREGLEQLAGGQRRLA